MKCCYHANFVYVDWLIFNKDNYALSSKLTRLY